MKKVLLIYPGQKNIGDINMPLALLFVARPLILHGYQPVIVDERVQDYRDLDLSQFLCVGISTMSGSMIGNALDAAKFIREKNPKIPIVWGGPHPTIEPETTIKSEFVDIVVVGEGEESLLETVQALEAGKSLEGIRGILYKKNGKVVRAEPRPQIDFDTEAHLPYELVDFGLYPNWVDKFEYHSSKGCPFRCTFCCSVANAGRSWRGKGPEVVMAELDHIMERFSPRRIGFMDPMFFLDKSRVKRIAEEIVLRKWNVEIYSFCRADVFSKFDDDFLKLIGSAGFREIAFGFESGSQRVLDHIRKGTTLEQQIATVEKCRQADIVPIISFIIGVPTETAAELEETLDHCDRIKTMHPGAMVNGLFIFVPFPGAPLSDYIAEHHGYRPPSTLEGWQSWRWSDKKILKWLDARQVERLQGISILSRYLFTMDLLRSWDLEQKQIRHGSYPLLVLSLLFNYAFWIPARVRWRYRWFRYAFEMRIWEKALERFKGNN